MSAASFSFSETEFGNNLRPRSGRDVLVSSFENLTDCSVSILIVSSSDLCNNLKESMMEYHRSHSKKYRFKLNVHMAVEVTEILEVRAEVHIDYVVLIADPRRANCESWIKDDLQHLAASLLLTGRCAVVVSYPNNADILRMVEYSGRLQDLCDEYHLHKLVQIEEGTRGECHIAARVLRLVCRAVGWTRCGVPDVIGRFMGFQDAYNSNSSENYESSLQN